MKDTDQRPVGITVVSVLWGISGGLTVLAGLTLMLAGAAFASWVGAFDGAAGASVVAVGLVVGTIVLAVGSLGIAVAVGLWRLQSWAWWTAVVLTTLTGLVDLLALATAPFIFLSVGSLLFLLLHIGSLAYLLTDEARAACLISTGRVVDSRLAVHSSTARPRSTACPNRACGRPVRSGWRFCAACSTPIGRTPARVRARTSR